MTEIRVPKPTHHQPEPNAFSSNESMSDKILEAANELASAVKYEPAELGVMPFEDLKAQIAGILRKHFQ